MGGGGPDHVCSVLQSDGIGGDFFRGKDVGLVRGHGEEDIRVPHGFFVAGDGEIGKEVNEWDLETGRGQSSVEGGGKQDIRTYIDRRQVTVAQWVALRPIFEVCVQEETGYAGRG